MCVFEKIHNSLRREKKHNFIRLSLFYAPLLHSSLKKKGKENARLHSRKIGYQTIEQSLIINNNKHTLQQLNIQLLAFRFTLARTYVTR